MQHQDLPGATIQLLRLEILKRLQVVDHKRFRAPAHLAPVLLHDHLLHQRQGEVPNTLIRS